jgi:ubiquinone/menaquinone biosynthesis C-methylase UbiE
MNLEATSGKDPFQERKHDYFAKSRFQLEEAARARRAEQGLTNQLGTEWAIKQIGEIAGGGLLLDLACGNGRHVEDLCEVAGSVLAGDYSEAMLRAARNILPTERQIPLVRLDAEQLPFADKSLDGIFCARFFHHLPKREIREIILAEAFRTSRKVAVVTFKARFSWEHLTFMLKCWVRSRASYRYFIPMTEFEEIARAHGWKVTRRYAARGGLSSNCVVVMQPME